MFSNIYPELKITPSETLDIQGLCKEGKNELKKGKNFKYIWSEIGDYRKQYEEFLSEIVPKLKIKSYLERN